MLFWENQEICILASLNVHTQTNDFAYFIVTEVLPKKKHTEFLQGNGSMTSESEDEH